MPLSSVKDIDQQITKNEVVINEGHKADIDLMTFNYPALHVGIYDHVNTRGMPMDFEDAHYLLAMYMNIDKEPNQCVIKSVQCGLSELYIIQSHIEASERGMTVMYVLPKYEIRNRFVNNRIYKLHRKVPRYARAVAEAETHVHRTSLMHFGKGTLAYVGSNVEDEFIEIPVDSAYVDELDRCDLSNLLLLPDRLTASPYAYQREISNPTVEGFGIDERYQESTQGEWNLKCPRCGKWFTPDFEKHVVEQIGANAYRARDPHYIPGSSTDAQLIHDCGGVVERLKQGRWVHSYDKRKWKGYRVSKLFSKFTTLDALIDKHTKALGNDRKIQVFQNSDLGKAYSSAGAKLTRASLNKCRDDYEFPVVKTEKTYSRYVGIDVGEVLHVVIREKIRNAVGYGYKFRLIDAFTVPGFSQLADVLREWRPKQGVIDSMPEIHKVAELKDDFRYMWSSRFQEKVAELTKHKHIREVRMDRTSILDAVKQGFELGNYINPMNAEFIDHGNYYEQMMASTRVLDANETNPEKSVYRWRHSKPDHFFLAEAYCLQASLLSPNSSVWEFFEESAKGMIADQADEVLPVDVENKLELAKMTDLTPEVFLANKEREINKPTAVKPEVNTKRIEVTCERMFESQGYVDIDIIVQSTNEHEGDVLRVLLKLGFEESKLSGQYIK